MVNRLGIALLIASISLIALSSITTIPFSQYFPLFGIASLFLAIYRFGKDREERRKKQRKFQDLTIKPVMAPIVTALKSNIHEIVAPSKIEEFQKEIEKISRDEKDVIPVILLMAYKYTEIIKIPEEYRKAFSLALTYKLSVSHDIQNGITSREINSSVTRNHKIQCGEQVWDLEKNDIDWYNKFSESDQLISHPFTMIFQEVRDVDSGEAEKIRNTDQKVVRIIQEVLKDNDVKFQKMMGLLRKSIPDIDFLKILVSLRTGIVLISRQGVSSTEDKQNTSSTHPTGVKYLKQAFQEKGLNLVRLNNAVDFAFLSDIVQDSDYRYFDLQLWGQQIAKRADELRKSDQRGSERKFNFVVLKSSLDELRSFGDELGSDSRIKIPPEMLSKISSKEMNASMLLTISKILRKSQSTSIVEFIDKNLEYLDSVTTEDIARNISEGLKKKFSKTDWKISDFIRQKVKTEDLTALGLTEEQSKNILDECSKITSTFQIA